VQSYVEARRLGDAPALERLRATDFIAEWPQSGERVVGADRMARVERDYPGGRPLLRQLRRIVGDADLWLIESGEAYPGDGRPWHLVELLRTGDGRVRATTVLFGEPFEAPAWRAAFADAFDPWEPPEVISYDHDLDPARAEELCRRYLASGRDVAVTADPSFAHGDLRLEMPQSGERIVGADRIRRMLEGYPGLPETRGAAILVSRRERWTMSPMLAPLRLASWGGLFLLISALDYGEGERWMEAAIAEVVDGRFARLTEYYFRPFEAPAWRASLVERYDPFG
jgi:hypothetical protein